MKSDVKIFSFTIAMLVLIIVSSNLIKSFLQSSTEKLNNSIDAAQKYIISDDWQKANNKIKVLNKDWEDLESKWSLFINHHEIDNISVSLENATQYAKFKNKEHASSFLSELKHYVDHIPDLEKMSLKNIL